MTQYWAACPIDQIAGKIKEKFENYRKWMETTGYADRIKTAYQRFYSMDTQGNLRIKRDENDIARIDVNHYKSFLKRMHIMATEAKLAYQPRANNSDTKSQIQSDIGRGACDYYGEEKNMNGVLSRSVLGKIIMLEMIIHCPWDLVEGRELTVDGAEIVRTGDQKFELFSAFNAARSTATDDSPWWIIRVKVNKYDYAALHPEFADEILASRVERDELDMDFAKHREESLYIDDDDHTYKFILYHKRTPALEHGRWVEVCAGQVLRDGPLKYPRMPVVHDKAGDVLESVFADSPSIDLLGVQEAMNALFSGAITNGLNNALQLLYCQDPNLITRRLETGQILVSANSKPEPLNLNGSNGELVKLIDMLMAHGQLVSGVNDVARGNPSSNLKSGASLAVVLAQAIQYISDIQKGYARAAGEVASILIDNLRTFGPEELIGYVVGDTRQGHVKTFKRDDLMDIARVTVDLGNPLTQTFAGRYELSMDWAQRGIMKSPKQIEAFIRTGNIDQITEDDFSDEILIRGENEEIKRGKMPPVLLLDNHAEHILKHKAIFASPEARSNPGMVKAGLAHIRAHIAEMRNVPPDIAAIIAGQPLPPDPNVAAPLPNQGLPTIDGARMPPMPAGAPAGAQQNYQQALDAIPEEQPMAAGFN